MDQVLLFCGILGGIGVVGILAGSLGWIKTGLARKKRKRQNRGKFLEAEYIVHDFAEEMNRYRSNIEGK